MCVPHVYRENRLCGERGRTVSTAETLSWTPGVRGHVALKVAVLEEAPTANLALVGFDAAVALDVTFLKWTIA